MIKRLLAYAFFPTLVAILVPFQALCSTYYSDFSLKGVLISPIGHSALYQRPGCE